MAGYVHNIADFNCIAEAVRRASATSEAVHGLYQRRLQAQSAGPVVH